jgi:mannose-6-phosphate isomerase-like protein (cupin superfamily)
MMHSREAIINVRTGQKLYFSKVGKETNGILLEIECISPPSEVKEPEHMHPLQENVFEIISGELHFWINGKMQTGLPGEVVIIPAGIPHYFWNGGETEAHYLQMFRPSLQIDTFFRTYFALARKNKLNKKGLPNLFLISLISLKHQNEIRLIKPPWVLQKIVFNIFAPIGRLLGYKASYD